MFPLAESLSISCQCGIKVVVISSSVEKHIGACKIDSTPNSHLNAVPVVAGDYRKMEITAYILLLWKCTVDRCSIIMPPSSQRWNSITSVLPLTAWHDKTVFCVFLALDLFLIDSICEMFWKTFNIRRHERILTHQIREI